MINVFALIVKEIVIRINSKSITTKKQSLRSLEGFVFIYYLVVGFFAIGFFFVVVFAAPDFLGTAFLI